MKSKIRDIIKQINSIRGTTIILTTHDIGDVEALCKRAVIIDKGKMVFDNNFEHLKNRFGKYRTLKIAKSDDENEFIKLEKAISAIAQGSSVSLLNKEDNDEENEKWFSLLIDEDQIALADVLNQMMKSSKIDDIKIEEIQTEDIIRKIYEGADNSEKN